MKTYRYILLDWDGNLAKTLDVWLEAKRAALENRGFHFSDEKIATSFGAPRQYFAEWGVTDVEAALDEMDKAAKQRLPGVELYPDALEVLEALDADGKQLALITSSLHENVQHLLEKYDVARHFQAIVAHDDVTHHKPHPEPLEKALRELDGNKQEAVMIGDSDKDLGAANNAGVDSILFYPPEHKKFYSLDSLQQLNPTHVVDDFRGVLKIV